MHRSKNTISIRLLQKLAPLLALITVSYCAAGSDRSTFKWVDDQGKIHYSDTYPPEEAKRGHTVLDPRGVVIDSVDAAKTEQQLAEQRRKEQLLAKQRRLEEERAANDRLLLNTFHDEKDLLHNRDSKLASLHQVIQLSQGRVDSLQEKLEKVRSSAAELERSAQEVTEEIETSLADLQHQIAETEQFIELRRQEQEDIRQQYEKDLERFRFLTSQRDGG